MKPKRLAIAQRLCRYLPPIISQRIRFIIYPHGMAKNDDYEFIVQSQTGSLFKNRTSDAHGYPFSIHGYNDWRNIAVALALASEGDAIIEIGANIGTETISFSDIVGVKGVVYAFEPLPSNLEALHENLNLNEKQNVVVEPFAVSDKDGKVQFVVPPKYSSGIGHILQMGDNDINGTIQVDCITLDSLSNRIGASKLIFIDTEGEEVKILRGARNYIREFQPTIVLEASSKLLRRAGFDIRELHSEIKKLNYKSFMITRLSLHEVEIIEYPNAHNWVCIPKGEDKLVEIIKSYFKRCGLFPCIVGFNPMTKR